MMQCPVALCGAGIRAGHLMCCGCWSRVPRKLQTSVNRSWATYRGTITSRNPDTKLEARRSYLSATQAAIDAAEASRP